MKLPLRGRRTELRSRTADDHPGCPRTAAGRYRPLGTFHHQPGAPMHLVTRMVLLAGLVPSALAAQMAQPLPLKHTPQPTVAAITAADLMTRLYIYADDSMMGRRAGTPDNIRSTAYIESEVRKMGLVPAGDSGGYFQNVPLVKETIDSTSTIVAGGTTPEGVRRLPAAPPRRRHAALAGRRPGDLRRLARARGLLPGRPGRGPPGDLHLPHLARRPRQLRRGHRAPARSRRPRDSGPRARPAPVQALAAPAQRHARRERATTAPRPRSSR